MDAVEAMASMSNTEIFDPNRPNLLTDNTSPAFAKLRRERELPQLT
jgi:hypothetical protein